MSAAAEPVARNQQAVMIRGQVTVLALGTGWCPRRADSRTAHSQVMGSRVGYLEFPLDQVGMGPWRNRVWYRWRNDVDRRVRLRSINHIIIDDGWHRRWRIWIRPAHGTHSIVWVASGKGAMLLCTAAQFTHSLIQYRCM